MSGLPSQQPDLVVACRSIWFAVLFRRQLAKTILSGRFKAIFYRVSAALSEIIADDLSEEVVVKQPRCLTLEISADLPDSFRLLTSQRMFVFSQSLPAMAANTRLEVDQLL